MVEQKTFLHKLRSWAWKLAVVLVLLTATYVWLSLHWSYANGERAGFVQKFSQRGWICKTWEGELAMINVPGTLTEKFYFTVPDEAVASKVTALMGKRVSLVYQQHVGVPSSCFGDSEYFVVDVKEVTE